jgi:hypothetical protein
MHLVSYTIKLAWKLFDRCLKEEDVWQPAPGRATMYLLRYLLQRSRTRVYAYEELLRILSSATVHKVTVSRPDVEYYPLAGRER